MTAQGWSNADQSDSVPAPSRPAMVHARGLIRIFPGAGANVAALRGLDLDVAFFSAGVLALVALASLAVAKAPTKSDQVVSA